MKIRRRKPEVVLRDGKPAAVIIDIEEYTELLERVEDIADAKRLETMRKRPLRFTKLEDFLGQRHSRV